MGMFQEILDVLSQPARTEHELAGHALSLLGRVLDWMADHQTAVLASKGLEAEQAPVHVLVLQAQHHRLSLASQHGQRLPVSAAGLQRAIGHLGHCRGNPALDALHYSAAATELVLAFYVSEPTYRVLEDEYRQLTAVMSRFIHDNPGLLSRIALRVLCHITEDLDDVSLGELSYPLRQELKCA